MQSTSIEGVCANTIRGLAMDAVQKANSGHPGAPMGMAEMATVLWGDVLKYDPSDASWPDRDRVVLSNGHASMLLYAMLHLTGTSLTLEDLKNFRQWGSPTAGHPEFGEAAGIETTTGPLGQGVANGVGMALAEAWLAARFGRDLVDHFTYVLCGDGCLMEGVAAEAVSLAGHLGLGRLIVLYDDNSITIDGSTDLAFGEDVGGRFVASGWEVLDADGHDCDELRRALAQAKASEDRPTLIRCRTVIGKGSPNLGGSNKTHGAPLGVEEIAASKIAMGMDPAVTFAVPQEVRSWFQRSDPERKEARLEWESRLRESAARERWQAFHSEIDLDGIQWPEFESGKKLATRKASHAVLNAAAAYVEQLVGGSADLAGSNGSLIKGGGDVAAGSMASRNLHFGVREHGMGAICNGLSLHGGVRPYCATFMVFHDYMRPSVRLAGLMHQPVVYVYTHDSVYLGEDGPTHQPIEHLMAMRSIPNLWVARPCDANETAEAWKLALRRTDGPVALCLTRQGLPTLDRSRYASAEGVSRGGYTLSDCDGTPDVVLLASGSEVELALEAQEALAAQGTSSRVVSMPCWEVFDSQDSSYVASVLPAGVPRVSIEAGSTFGWARYVGLHGASVGIDRFGASAPGSVVAEKLGISLEGVLSAVSGVLAQA
jgi:transketolase